MNHNQFAFESVWTFLSNTWYNESRMEDFVVGNTSRWSLYEIINVKCLKLLVCSCSSVCEPIIIPCARLFLMCHFETLLTRLSRDAWDDDLSPLTGFYKSQVTRLQIMITQFVAWPNLPSHQRGLGKKY